MDELFKNIYLVLLNRWSRARDFADQFPIVLGDSERRFRQNTIQGPKTLHKELRKWSHEHPNIRKHEQPVNLTKLITIRAKLLKFSSDPIATTFGNSISSFNIECIGYLRVDSKAFLAWLMKVRIFRTTRIDFGTSTSQKSLLPEIFQLCQLPLTEILSPPSILIQSAIWKRFLTVFDRG